MKLITLFSGTGMQEEGIINTGTDYELINFCEYDPKIAKCFSLVHNEPESKNLGDITKIDMKKYYQKLIDDGNDNVDIIISSFPCQSFSIAGKKQGFECKKNGGLFDKSFEMISLVLPKFVIFENVKNITSKKFNAVDTITKSMTGIGYSCFHKILNSSDYGIPQNRERWFMVCVKNCEKDFVFPDKIPLTKCVEDYLSPDVERQSSPGMDMFYNEEYKKEFCSTRGLIKVFDGVQQGHFTTGFTLHRMYSIKGISPTFTTSNDTHFWEIKGKLLPEERWRLMGLKEDKLKILKDNNIPNVLIHKICGNGIVVDVFQHLFQKLKDTYFTDE